jgi:putative SOS response-associated peptidase YedK
MCGRIVQFDSIPVYLEALSPQLELITGFDPEPISRYNVSPGSNVTLLRSHDQALIIEKAKWGYRPFWAEKNKRPPSINARVETAASKSYYRSIWQKGRALIPANGWYEWIKSEDQKYKQPYFITHQGGEPMFMAAIGEFKEHQSADDRDSFVILTSPSDKGMVDIHDRRPVVLSAEEANKWLDPNTTPAMAEEIARDRAEPVEAYIWYPVSTDANKSSNEGRHLIDKINDPAA